MYMCTYETHVLFWVGIHHWKTFAVVEATTHTHAAQIYRLFAEIYSYRRNLLIEYRAVLTEFRV